MFSYTRQIDIDAILKTIESAQQSGCYSKDYLKLFNAIKETPDYKKINDTDYSTPRGYLSLNNVSMILASFRNCVEHNVVKLNPNDPGQVTLYEFSERIVQEKMSRFWVKRELFEAFNYSDLPKQVPAFRTPFKNAVFMLPESIAPKELGRCLWIGVSCLEPKENYLSFSKVGINAIEAEVLSKRILIVTQLDNFIVYTRVIQFSKEYQVVVGEFRPSQIFSDSEATDEEKQFLDTITSFALKCIFYLNENTEELTTIPSRAIKTKGFGRSNKLNPVWLGETYRTKYESINSSPNIEKKIPNRWVWVRGFWRNQKFGTKFQNVKLIWIHPRKRFIYSPKEG
jgi:hypothetical protein